MYFKSAPKALKSAEIIIPERISVIIDCFSFPESLRVSQTVKSPKTSASNCTLNILREKIIPIIAPSDVPLVTPRISGVASEFEKRD